VAGVSPCEPSPGRCGRGEPSPGADVAGVGPVPVQSDRQQSAACFAALGQGSTHTYTHACAVSLSRRLHRFRFGAPSRPRRIPRHRRAPPTRSRRRRRSRPRPSPTASLRSKRWSSEVCFSRLRHIRTATGLTPAASAPRLGSPRHIYTGTGLTPAASATGLGSPLSHPHWDRAHPCYVCTRVGARVCVAGCDQVGAALFPAPVHCARSDRRCGAGPILLEPTSGVDVGGVIPVPVPM
jgi:hypothetical protein